MEIGPLEALLCVRKGRNAGLHENCPLGQWILPAVRRNYDVGSGMELCHRPRRKRTLASHAGWGEFESRAGSRFKFQKSLGDDSATQDIKCDAPAH